MEASHNVVGGYLICSSNVPPATNEGVANNTAGSRYGECSTL
ncbi:MAG TPA: hypothetical protein VG076_16335 [Acidimicrobiales bacterium]|nr:hypothetical protein [Acidimicrobiales bacterium]